MTFTAYTAYHRPMLQFWLETKEDVAAWVEHQAPRWPGSYIKRNNRVVWRDQGRKAA